MAMTRNDILEHVRAIMEEALGVDAEEVVPGARLTADLGAESIDFLDIVFRLEKTFSTAEQPFKISQGELFPENLVENEEWVADGRFTDTGVAMLKDRLPHVDLSGLDEHRDLATVADFITVESIIGFVERKLAGSPAPA